MSKFAPPGRIRELMAKGLAASPGRDETTALTRYFHRLFVARTPEANDLFVQVFHTIADRSAARAEAGQRVACAKGCSHCCNAHVTVLAPEAFALARAVRSRARHGALHDRSRSHTAARGAMTPQAARTQPLACAFLVEGLCSAYTVRPMTCRMFASLDLRACVAAIWSGVGDIPQPHGVHEVRSMLAVIAYAAMQAAKLPVMGYELNATLVALIDRPALEAEWYAGRDAFESGELDRLSDGVRMSVDAFVLTAGL